MHRPDSCLGQYDGLAATHCKGPDRKQGEREDYEVRETEKEVRFLV